MIVKAIKTRVFQEGEDLFLFITEHIKKIPEDAVIVITSKIVALAEERTMVIENQKTKEKAIRSESSFVLKTKYVWLTIKDGMILPSAGIDESNADGKLILLPKNSFQSASMLRNKLKKHYQVSNLGIIVTDSCVIPLRSGVVGVALGYAGFKGIRNYQGTPDIYGKMFKFSSTDVADSLATAAALLMGEGAEKQPLALIKNAPVQFCEKVNRNELHIDMEDDMFKPFFQKILNKKR